MYARLSPEDVGKIRRAFLFPDVYACGMRFKVLRFRIGCRKLCRFYFTPNCVTSEHDLRYFAAAFGLSGSEVINITRRENHCSSFNGITYCSERLPRPYDKRVNAMRRNSFVLIMATAWITKHRRFCETWPVKVKLTRLIRFNIINFTNW